MIFRPISGGTVAQERYPISAACGSLFVERAAGLIVASGDSSPPGAAKPFVIKLRHTLATRSGYQHG